VYVLINCSLFLIPVRIDGDFLNRELKKSLVQKYKKFAEDLIKLKGFDVSKYKFVESRFRRINELASAGPLHPIYNGEPVPFWFRLPNPDFDKDSYIYMYCCSDVPGYSNNIIINAITNEKHPHLIVVRYDYIG